MVVLYVELNVIQIAPDIIGSYSHGAAPIALSDRGAAGLEMGT